MAIPQTKRVALSVNLKSATSSTVFELFVLYETISKLSALRRIANICQNMFTNLITAVQSHQKMNEKAPI